MTNGGVMGSTVDKAQCATAGAGVDSPRLHTRRCRERPTAAAFGPPAVSEACNGTGIHHRRCRDDYNCGDRVLLRRVAADATDHGRPGHVGGGVDHDPALAHHPLGGRCDGCASEVAHSRSARSICAFRDLSPSFAASSNRCTTQFGMFLT